ncbi:MAG TPA: hypothetical protein PKZ35_13555 [Gammaproteobacteria bacterium]|nr:hypothetical protein [Chromatiaceae bacterium]HPE81018.1 hypothetical protein [Gammaproteobacteria bacterium]
MFCIYLVTFAGINFKEVQNENWFISSNYMVGLILCLPAAFILGLMPESWNPSAFQSNLFVAFISVALAAAFVFYGSILAFFEKRKGE